MSLTIVLTLLLLAAIGFAGAGMAFGIARAREIAEAEHDFGMRSVAVVLAGFGASCTFVAVGFTGIFAFGAVIAWASYVLTAQQLGAFRIQEGRPHTDSIAERRLIG